MDLGLVAPHHLCTPSFCIPFMALKAITWTGANLAMSPWKEGRTLRSGLAVLWTVMPFS